MKLKKTHDKGWEKPAFKIRVDKGEYLIDLDVRVTKGFVLRALNMALKKLKAGQKMDLNVKEFDVPKKYLSYLNKKTRPIIMDIARQVKAKHPTFKVYSSELQSAKFKEDGPDHFNGKLIFTGLCHD